MGTLDTYTQIAKLHEVDGKNWSEIGAIVGIDRRTAKRRYDKYLQTQELIDLSTDMALELESNKVAPVGGPRHITCAPDVDKSRFEPLSVGGDMMVSCDWHIPLYDPYMVNSLFDVAYDFDIKKLIIGGDLFNGDAFSRYDDKQARKEAGYIAERTHSLEIMDAVLDNFDEVYLFEGNHDFRFIRLFNGELTLEEVVKEVILAGLSKEKLDRLVISPLDYMYLEQDKLFRFSHQKNFSTVPLAVGYKFAAKFECSIITAHSHHFGMGVAKDGHNLIIEGGGLYDKSITQYVQKSSDHHEWVQGYTMFKDGIPTLFSPEFGNV